MLKQSSILSTDTVIYSFIQNYVLSIYFTPGTMIDTENIDEQKP